MPPHNLIAFPTRRTLADILRDLKEASRDWDAALDSDDADSGDRMSEADQRIDVLREEFSQCLEEATGLTWAQIDAAVSECLL
jgi:hypothetical protein